MVLKDKWDQKTQTGIIRTNHKGIHPLKATLAMVGQINSQPVIMRSKGVSGMINKVEKLR